MPGLRLTSRRAGNLLVRVISALRAGELRAPLTTEGETQFTRSVLTPHVQSLLDGIAFPGLLLRGDGAASVTPAHLLGAPFYPDIAIEHYRRPVIALEVKLLRGASRQNSIATAIGQATIYRQRYQYVGVVFIDIGTALPIDETLDSTELLEGLDLPFVYRCGLPGGQLTRHPDVTGDRASLEP